MASFSVVLLFQSGGWLSCMRRPMFFVIYSWNPACCGVIIQQYDNMYLNETIKHWNMTKQIRYTSTSCVNVHSVHKWIDGWIDS